MDKDTGCFWEDYTEKEDFSKVSLSVFIKYNYLCISSTKLCQQRPVLPSKTFAIQPVFLLDVFMGLDGLLGGSKISTTYMG